MQEASWMELLRRFPPAKHDTLVIMTTAGCEVSIQNILRFEPEFLVVRGRMAGTTDNGRILFIPYAQINYVAFVKPMAEAAIHAMFDGGSADGPATAEAAPPAEAAGPEGQSAEGTAEPEPTTPTPVTGAPEP